MTYHVSTRTMWTSSKTTSDKLRLFFFNNLRILSQRWKYHWKVTLALAQCHLSSLSWISAGFSYSLHCRNPKICYLVGYNALQRRDKYTKLIYIWLSPKPVGTIPGASSGSVDFLLTARSPNFFCGRFSRSSMLNIVVVSILKHSQNCKPS